jgi:hypothetical protein
MSSSKVGRSRSDFSLTLALSRWDPCSKYVEKLESTCLTGLEMSSQTPSP